MGKLLTRLSYRFDKFFSKKKINIFISRKIIVKYQLSNFKFIIVIKII